MIGGCGKFQPFSKRFISVLFNLRLDKLTIWKFVFGLVIYSYVGFGLGTKKYLYFGFDYILCFENWLKGVGKVGLWGIYYWSESVS